MLHTDEPYRKSISVASLRSLLDGLEDQDRLVPNQVFNLTIFRDEEYVGFIDIADESIDMFDSQDSPRQEKR